MSHILGIGIAVLDIIYTVADYPAEDDEIRALNQRQSLGGNAVNTLAVLSQLGHQCSWAGVYASDQGAQFIHDQLASFAIDSGWSRRQATGKTPTSYIILNSRNGSRTIVHYRDLTEYAFTDFDKINLPGFDWIHFEGRNIEATVTMCHKLRQHHPHIPISIEIEKNRPHISQLLPLADLLLFSKHYASELEHSDGAGFVSAMHEAAPEAEIICAWGEQGAYACDRDGHVSHSPAYPPARIIDTLAAGDTFNAGLIDARLQGATLHQALQAGCRLAGEKCGHSGIRFIDQSNPAGMT